MPDFSDIKGVGKAGRRLLDAAGIRTLADLADADESALFGQLSAINREQRIARQAPPRKVVAYWIDSAVRLVEAATSAADPTSITEESEFADRDAYEAALQRAPSARILYDEDGTRLPPPGARDAPVRVALEPPIADAPDKRPLDRSRIPTFDDVREGRIAIQPLGTTLGSAAPRPLPRPSPDGTAPRSALRPPARPPTPEESPAAPRPESQPTPDETNRRRAKGAALSDSTGSPDSNAAPGRKTDAPASGGPVLEPLEVRRLPGRLDSDQKVVVPRWVRRGVSYPEPVQLYFGMLLVLVSRLLFYMVAIGTPVVLLLRWWTGDDYIPRLIPVWIAFVVVGILHLIVAAYFRCRICTCHFLFARRCHKNKKAHRPFPLGWVGSTALHAILFRWFRCMYCGTAIQIGEQKKPQPR